MNRKPFVLGLGGSFAARARAQCTGPCAAAPVTTAAQPRRARPGSHFAVEGGFGAHQRQDDHSCRDGNGEIRVEIDPAPRQNRVIGPGDKLRPRGHLHQGKVGRSLSIQMPEVPKLGWWLNQVSAAHACSSAYAADCRSPSVNPANRTGEKQ
jgi:uncharacterized protein YdeI (BOF family)